MSTQSVRALQGTDFPPLLREIPQPPQALWAVGTLPPPDLKLLAVVGARDYTSYGKQVVETLIGGLRGQPIGIISGLARGTDTLAHEAALRHHLYTLAVPGSGLNEDVIYPASNKRLARQIVDAGGGLLSEFAPTMTAAKWTFPQRNRIMAGMCHATLLIEAAEKSGTLITARMATDYNRELLVVPGSIFSKTSQGTHQFLKLGATPVTTAADILEVLHLSDEHATRTKPVFELTPTESTVIGLLHEPRERDALLRQLSLPTEQASVLLMEMEIKGYIACDNGHYRACI